MNKENNVCIMIMGDYPYLKGETFYEDEAPYTSKYFDSVLVFSLNADEGAVQTRKTPENFKCFPISRISGKRKYAFYLMRGFFGHSKYRHSDSSLKHRLADDYLLGKSETEFKIIKGIIDKEHFDEDTQFLIYSYWFFDHALIAVRIKEYLAKQGYKVNAISRAHGYDLYPERNKLNYLPYRELLLDRLDRVFPCSQNGVDYLSSKYPALRDKIELARLGTPDFGFNSSFNDSHTIATCCFFSSLKRMPFFAEAFCLLCKEDLKAKWICIGDGPDLSLVKKIISDYGFENRVVFTGALEKKDVIEIYKNTDIALFCNVSENEGVPVSIMEAQSFGIPVIATDVGGTGEILDKHFGELVPLKITKYDMANRIASYLKADEKKMWERRRLARKSWELKSNGFKLYKDFYSELLLMIE